MRDSIKPDPERATEDSIDPPMTIQTRLSDPAALSRDPAPPAGADSPGAAVLLIHGLGGTPNEMRSVARRLRAAGFAVECARLAGHCGSEADLLRTGWHDWYDGIAAIHQDLVRRHARVFVAGLCLGALLALSLAARRPGTVAGLALYSLPLWYDGWSLPRPSWLLPLFLRTKPGLSYRFVGRDPFSIKDERLRRPVAAAKGRGDSLAAGTAGISGASLREMGDLVADLKPRLPGIQAPALILHAVEDDLCGLRNPRYVARHLGGPARTVLLGDCYHLITVDRQRDTVARETAAFFAEVMRATPPRR